jgi:hypothetical protein
MLRDAEGMPNVQNQAAIQPTQILTPDNIKQTVGNDTTWGEPKDALDQFKQLWHVQ